MKIEPFGKRVVAKRIEVVQQSEAGLVMPSQMKKGISGAGEVVYVGADVTKVKEGDKVMFATFGNVEFLGEPLVVAYEDDIIGKIVD